MSLTSQSLFLIIIALVLLFLGFWLILHAFKCFHDLVAKCGTDVPEAGHWTIGNEFSMALVLGNASFFFAYHCLRGYWVLLVAAVVITVITAIGSHYRYKQILQPLSLAEELRTQLMSVHRMLALGLFLTIGPQLALILIFLRLTGRL